MLELSATARLEAAADRSQALQDRGVGAGTRMQAEKDRHAAMTDRGAGADERVHAGRDRTRARADRSASAQDRLAASTDARTGALVREAGLIRIRDEVAAAGRECCPLSVGWLRLSGADDGAEEAGQVGADSLLVLVANGLIGAFADQDVLVRYGPQELVCAFPGMAAGPVTERLRALVATLSGPPRCGSVTIGVAELAAGETVEQLIERAEAAGSAAVYDTP